MVVEGTGDERALLLGTLAFLRDAVIGKAGIIYHLAHVEWRWISGALRRRAEATDEAVLGAPSLDVRGSGAWGEQRDLRWALVHLIQETARRAGHADATRELPDGTTG